MCEASKITVNKKCRTEQSQLIFNTKNTLTQFIGQITCLNKLKTVNENWIT